MRSPGCPRLADAYSRTKYSRVTPATLLETNSMYRPIPCCSWTTKSPAFNSSGSIAVLRFDGSFSVLLIAPLLPDKSLSVIKRMRAEGTLNPNAIVEVTTRTEISELLKRFEYLSCIPCP